MKLGEMLVRDGRVSQEALERALSRQAREGGRLGTVLVEMGLIDTDALTVYLGLELGIPIATTAALGRAKSTAVRLLTAEQAARYRCVPILIQERHLIAAMDDPLDWEILDEIARVTGYQVIPRVAPETRIFYYLEVYYGVSRPPRLTDLGAPASTGASSRDDLPAPPLPGLPPRAQAPVPAPSAAAPLRAVRAGVSSRAGEGEPPSEQEALELDAADLVEELDADEAAEAGEAPGPAAGGEREPAPTRAETPVPAAEDDARGPIVEPLPKPEATERMAAARSREEVADALLGYALGHFDTALLFIVRDQMAFGWKAAGRTVDRSRVDALLIPLEAPSMFQVAIYNEGVFRGRPFPATLHNYFYRVLRAESPPYGAVFASFIGSRPVNLLYGHIDSGEPLADAQLDELGEVTRAASDTYVRLIAASKEARARW